MAQSLRGLRPMRMGSAANSRSPDADPSLIVYRRRKPRATRGYYRTPRQRRQDSPARTTLGNSARPRMNQTAKTPRGEKSAKGFCRLVLFPQKILAFFSPLGVLA